MPQGRDCPSFRLGEQMRSSHVRRASYVAGPASAILALWTRGHSLRSPVLGLWPRPGDLRTLRRPPAAFGSRAGLLGLALRRVSRCAVDPAARPRAPAVARVLAVEGVPFGGLRPPLSTYAQDATRARSETQCGNQKSQSNSHVSALCSVKFAHCSSTVH
jgi:hypothetical protein